MLNKDNSSLADHYLDLLIRSLSRFDHIDDFEPYAFGVNARFGRKMLARYFVGRVHAAGAEIVKRVPFVAEMRRLGRDWPMYADTMIGLERLKNIRYAVRTVIEEGVEGDLVETGVWRGGGSIMLRACLEAYGDREREVWVCDSFEGLPPPDVDRYPQDAGQVMHTWRKLAISLEQVKANFKKYGYLDDRVHFLKGWFKDTLPTAPIEKVSVLRLDGDLYASTMDALNPLYDKVSKGGFIIVDDYGIGEDVCRRAIEDFRAARGIATPLIDIDGWAKYWRKE